MLALVKKNLDEEICYAYLDGNDKGPWKNSDDYRIFVDCLKPHLKSAQIEELSLHINDDAFADACVDAFVKIANN